MNTTLLRTVLVPAALVALLLPCCIGSASAQRVADPGFAFVDVNGDGLYSASDGDIGLASTPSVDINALILANSGFNTGMNAGNYHAPHHPASLVIPASQTFVFTTPLILKAGMNIVVNGTLQAPSISLTATGVVNLTQSVLDFQSTLTTSSGSDTILNGTAAFGSSNLSEIVVHASGNVYALSSGSYETALGAGDLIDLEACQNATIASASLFTEGSASSITVEANSNVSITTQSYFDSGYQIDIESGCSNGGRCGWGNGNGHGCGGGNGCGNCGGWGGGNGCGNGNGCGGGNGNGGWCGNNSTDVVINSSDLFASDISAESRGGIDVRGSIIDADIQLELAANGNVIGSTSSTDIVAGALQVLGGNGVDFSSAALSATGSNYLDIESSAGTVTLNGTAFAASAGINVHAAGNIAALNAVINADNFVQLQSDRSGIQINSTTIGPEIPSISGMSISLKAQGEIDANQSALIADTTVNISSSRGNIVADGADIQASAASGSLTLYAGGGTIYIVGSDLVGGTVFGPNGVNVITQ